ncbi:universal stress protein [Rhizobium leguminosarum]|uniref:universal stress protein n=1 Tax=Rhizobium leguminosarum TaxID=384 RepID=UPI000FF2DC0F|nr:universal stress protein [Rhizobium leguminosarum]RWY71663.1 universal stress protein [Rhizobium leguminosarum]
MFNPSLDVSGDAVVNQIPSHIVFATDFTARCDRAQDRAVQLAIEWSASLTAVHAIDDAGIAANASIRHAHQIAARRKAKRLREDLAGIEGLRSSVLVKSGRPATVVQALATRERADLIVTGLARSMILGVLPMGSTVMALARSSIVPVLVVKKKLLDTRSRMLVATDLTASSSTALQVALNWFPNGRHGLFHVIDPPYRMWAEDKAAYLRQVEQFAIDECARFAVEAAGAAAPNRFDITVRDGDVVDVLRPVVDQGDLDLVIVGTHGRTDVMNFLLGSVSSRIVNEIESDVLVVPPSF